MKLDQKFLLYMIVLELAFIIGVLMNIAIYH